MNGIAVDDSIHFITHYRAELIEMRGDIIAAIKARLQAVEQAITFSTIILSLGFLILISSNHLGLVRFGYLSAIAFTSALLADFFLLPSLFVLFKVKSKVGEETEISKQKARTL